MSTCPAFCFVSCVIGLCRWAGGRVGRGEEME